MGSWDAELEALAPYLLGEQPREDGEWDMYCPLHEDQNRSAQLNVDKGLWYCQACDQGGTLEDLVRQKADWKSPQGTGTKTKLSKRRTKRKVVELDRALVDGWSTNLLGDPAIMSDFTATRGIYESTAARHKIGWSDSHHAYTIPVFDDEGALLNVRYYQLRPPKGRRKIWGEEGHNEPVLYPASALDAEEIIVCEGELDALITGQHGFSAVTRTGAARVWKSGWSQRFKGKTVYVCHDTDDTGRAANLRVARGVAKYAASVHIVTLPYPHTEKHGKDLTDWWMDHDGDADAFRRLLEEAEPWEVGDPVPEGDEIEDVSVVNSFDAGRVGRPSRMTVTIKGRHEPGFSVPRRAVLSCDKEAGAKCNICPMFETKNGRDEVFVKGDDEAVQEMMEATKPQLKEILRLRYGAVKCGRLSIDIKEHQSVEILHARPSVDRADGGEIESAYKSIKIISVGRHDTMTNNTVRLVGALQPDPRSQRNEFQAWDVTKMETSLDRFAPTDADMRKLRKFKPSKGQRPIEKLMEIADDLASHVTFIYGRPELHAAIDLVYHSVLSFPFGGKTVGRGWLDLMLIGDTRTGKSEAATRMRDHYSAGEIVSCESASFAGIIGGLQQFGGGKEWSITWGAIPLNDRRLVVLDEASGLTADEIGEMSSVRSSGVAQLTKIQQEETLARTRLIWIANPRNGRMSDYTYGVQALQPLVGRAEDIARFDLAMSVAAGEVPASEINRRHREGRTKYDAKSCEMLVRWAWSRRADQIVWGTGAEEAVYKAAIDLGGRYVEDPPLIQAANVREKVARIAVALAARLFSSDDGERLIVRASHVRDAVSFLDSIYSSVGFGYAERSRELIQDRTDAVGNAQESKDYLYNRKALAKFLRRSSSFRRQDIEEVMNVDKDQANAIINTLWEWRMVRKDKGDIKVEPTLQQVLREINLR